jgi:hypothetical protein
MSRKQWKCFRLWNFKINHEDRCKSNFLEPFERLRWSGTSRCTLRIHDEASGTFARASWEGSSDRAMFMLFLLLYLLLPRVYNNLQKPYKESTPVNPHANFSQPNGIDIRDQWSQMHLSDTSNVFSCIFVKSRLPDPLAYLKTFVEVLGESLSLIIIYFLPQCILFTSHF